MSLSLSCQRTVPYFYVDFSKISVRDDAPAVNSDRLVVGSSSPSVVVTCHLRVCTTSLVFDRN